MSVVAARIDAALLRRVAVVAYHSSPLAEPGSADAGGMTIYVRKLAEALSARGVHTDVFTRFAGSGARMTQLSQRVRVVAIDAGPPAVIPKDELPSHIDEFVAGVRAFATAQRSAYDIVHSHYWQSGLAATSLVEGWDIPLVHSHHTLGRVKNSFLAPGDVAEPQSRLDGEARVIDAADVLIASTDAEFRQLACLYGASHDRLKTLHPGVDHRLFQPGNRRASREELGLTGEAVVLYAGRIQPLKGLELAIRSVHQLVSALDRKLVFVLAGGISGPRGEDELRRLKDLVTSLGVEDNVRFAGPQPHSRLPVLYRAADAVVVCSHSESFGLAALEAHACGTPVVGTAVGGLSYIVEDGSSGFLVDTRDPATFASKLRALLENDALSHSFRKAAARRAQRFSWEQTADAAADLYECLMSERLPEACVC